MGRVDIADIDILYVYLYIKSDIIKRIRYFFIPKKVFVKL